MAGNYVDCPVGQVSGTTSAEALCWLTFPLASLILAAVL